MSTETTGDPGPFDYTNRPFGIYPFPIAASTSNYKAPLQANYFDGVSAATVVGQIQDQIFQYGWSSVMMHPQEFANKDAQGAFLIPNTVNTTTLNTLRNVLLQLRGLGYRLCPIGNIQNFFFNTTRDPCLGPPPTTTAQPTTSLASTAQPTTAQATTAQATTVQATTAIPTTAQVTTATPTTAIIVGSTAAPTTVQPTTVQATTAQVTTSQATTSVATTSVATTSVITTAVNLGTTRLASTQVPTTGAAPATTSDLLASAVSLYIGGLFSFLMVFILA
jgi:hypothetical protein